MAKRKNSQVANDPQQSAEAVQSAQGEVKTHQEEISQKQLLEMAVTGIIITRMNDSVILYANAEAERMFRSSRDKWIGQPSLSIYVNLEDRKPIMVKLHQTGYVRDHEIHLKRADGEQFWALISVQPVEFEGESHALLTTMIDITERKQSEIRQRTILETMPVGILITEPIAEGRVLYSNSEFARMLGTTPDTIIGNPVPDLYYDPEDRPKVLKQVREKGSVQNYPVRGKRVNGEPFWSELSIQPMDYEGTPALLTALTDTTQRRTAEVEHEQFTLQLNTAAEIATQVGSILDPDKLLQTVIPLIKERFGLYYAHVYVLDEKTGMLNLRAGYGEAGRIMLERGHSIPLSREQSLVATAARTRKLVHIPDVTKSPVFLPNPLLSDTRTEVAVPLVVGDRVLGVFDIQHDVADYFAQSYLDVFTTLAGQIAIALQNARTLTEIDTQRAFYDGIITNLPVGVWAVDKQFTPLLVNPAGRDMMGREVIDKDGGAYVEAYDVINVDTGEIFDNTQLPLVKAVTQGGVHSTREAGVRWPDGTVVPMLINAAPLTDSDGKQTGAVVIFVDATEQRAAQEALAERVRLTKFDAEIGAMLAEANELPEILQQCSEIIVESLDVTLARAWTLDAAKNMLELQGSAGLYTDLDGPHKHIPVNAKNPIGNIALQQQPYHTTKIVGGLRAEDDPQWAKKTKIGAFAGYPLLVGERTVGILGVFSQQPLKESSSETLSLVANSIALGIDRKQAEAAVKANEARFRDVATNIVGWVWEVNSQGQYTYCSEKVTEVLGYSVEEMLGKTPFDFMLPEEVTRIAPLFGEIIARKENIVDLANWNLRKDGSHICLITNGVAFLDENGDLLGYRGVDSDITESTRARVALESFAAQLSTASEIAGRVNAILDPDQLLNSVIPLLKERFDLYYVHVYTLEETTLALRAGYGEPGRVMLEQGHNIPLDREASVVATAARTKQLVHVPDVTVSPEFMPNPLLPDTKTEVAVPLVVGGEVLGVFDIQHDIPNYFNESYLNVFTTLAGQIATALQNARVVEETERQRALYDSILKNLPVGVWAVDQQFNVMLINDAGRAMMGREIKDKDGGSYTETYEVINTYTGEPYDNTQLPLVKTVTQGGSHTISDAGLRWPDGTVIPQMINSGPLLDPQGKQVGAVVIFANITEQRQAQQEIERLLQQTSVRFEVSQALAGDLSEEQVLDILIQKTEVFPDARVTLNLVDPEAEELTIVLVRAEAFQSELEAKIPIGMRFTSKIMPILQLIGPNQPFVSPNLSEDERVDAMTKQLTARQGTVSMAIIPMTVGTDWLGVITIASGKENYFDEHKLHLYQTLAEQGANALRTARLRSNVRRNLEQTSTRLQVSQALAGDLNEEEVLDILVQQTGVFPDARITLNLVDPKAEELTIVLVRAEAFQSGLEAKIPIGMRFTSKIMPLLQLIGPNQSFLAQNLSTDDRFDDATKQLMERQGTLSMAIIPMTAGTEWLGVITVAAKDANYFDDHKLHMYQTIAEQGANALRTARLRDGVRRSLAQTSARLRVSQELAGTQTEGQVLDAIIRASNFYPETQIGVFMLDRKTEDLAVEVCRIESFESNLAETVKPGMRFAASEFPMVALVADGKTFISGNLLTDERADPASRQTARQLGEHSLAVIPMNIGGEQLGFLTIGTAEIDFFDERKMFLYESLAEQGAIALRAARLQAELQSSVARFEGFANNTAYGFGIYDMDEKLIYANPAFYQILHEDSLKTINEHEIQNYLAENQFELLQDQIQPTIMREGHWSGELTLSTSDKQLVPVFVDYFLIRDATGQPRYIANIITDITERKAAEARIAEQVAIIDASPDFISASGMDMKGTYINPAGLAMTGYTKEEFDNGMDITQFQPDLPSSAFETVLKKGEWEGESTLVHKNGRSIPVLQFIGLRTDISGKPTGFFTVIHDMTEARNAQVAITAERDRAQRYLETVGSLVIALNTKGEITLANRAYCQTFGYTEAELIGKNWFDLGVAEASSDFMKENFAKIMTGEVTPTERYEGKIPTKAGEIRSVSWHTALLYDQTGAIVGVLSSGEDITERLRAEAERTRLSAVLEATSDFVGIAEMDGRGVYFNRGARKMIGLSMEADPASYDISSVVPERELARTMDEIIPTAIKDGIWSGESVIKTLDEREIPALMTIITIKDQEGKPQYLANVSRDISDIRAAQEQASLLAAIVESADEAILSASPQGNILSWNPAAERISGYNAEEMIGKSAVILAPDHVRERVGGMLQSLMKGEHVEPLETQWLTKDGHILDIILATSPIYNASGDVTAIAAMATDITERKHAEVERERFTTQLSTAAEIAQSVGAILDTDELLNTVIPLLKERFGLYHAHVYVVDDEAQSLRLRSGYGQVGKIMQQQGHKIALDNERSLVVRAARTKTAVVSNNVTEDPNFMPNLLLPETQSEVAVPFMIGEEVLGVFDVQASQINFFTEADLDVFRTLAGQIANAFQSARLFEQQRKAQVSQREAAERIRAIFEAMTEGITVSNTLGQIEDLNEATLHLHKYTDRGELLGRSQMELFARNDWANASRGIRQALEKGRSETAEYRMLCKDGSTFNAEQNSALLHDADGNPAGFVSITRDITERKRAEEALQLTRASVDETDAEIFWFGSDGKFTDVNDTACKMLEYKREELLEMDIFDIDKDFPHDSLPKILTEVRETGTVTLTSSHHTKKGRIFPVEANFYSVEFGKQLRYFLFARDITERLSAEAERERFTTQLRTAAEVSMQVGAILDPEKLLELVVPLIAERFDLYHVHVYTLDEETQTLTMRVGSGEIGKLMREQTHTIPLDRENSLVARVARSQKALLVNNVAQEPGFMPNPLLPDTRSELTVPLIVGEQVLGVLDVQDDEVQRFTQNDMDVFTTLAGQIAAALLTATSYRRVLEVDRLKGEFLANMSHELRTPLNSILGYTEVMLMGIDGELTAEMSEDVQAIFENGQQLLRLINDILDLTKIEAGRMVLTPESVDIIPLLEDSKVNNQGLLLKRKTDVEIVIEANDDLPIITADRVRLGQILNNLVSNAVKFTEKGFIYLRAFHTEDYVYIEVEDTGMGISKEDQTKIFQRFRQVDGSSTRRAEGTGLGLAITRSLVQMHGWELRLTSEAGKGSKFSIEIPFKAGQDEATL
ncbi:MAG: PAS domain S-box protein [Anaerolineae bacterium]|nr:PAS domain S-box protein [Anaerolineae bacterium]